eukprot:scaffold1229_cov400-Prasinococcus_capsulatus_cf.AAC.7
MSTGWMQLVHAGATIYAAHTQLLKPLLTAGHETLWVHGLEVEQLVIAAQVGATRKQSAQRVADVLGEPDVQYVLLIV